MLLITRESVSTQQEQSEWRRGLRLRRPVANVSHVVIHLADGQVEYLSGCRYSLRAAYLKHAGTVNHIVNVRLVRQPLHLLTKGNQ